MQPKTKSAPSMPLNGRPPATKEPLTNAEKVLWMQDRLLDAVDIPVMALWHDESVATVNKALARLMHHGSDAAEFTDPSTVISNFNLFTEDFQRPLIEDEYPIVAAW